MESSNPTHGDRQASSHSPSALNRRHPPHELPTILRKRFVLDYDSSARKITTSFSLNNNNNFSVAFKVHSSFKRGYVIEPNAGIVLPGEALDVIVMVNDSESVGHDLEKDVFSITLGAVDSDGTAENDINYDEEHTRFIGVTQSAKDRLAFLAAVHESQTEKLKSVLAEEQRLRVMASLGTTLIFIGASFVFFGCIV